MMEVLSFDAITESAAIATVVDSFLDPHEQQKTSPIKRADIFIQQV